MLVFPNCKINLGLHVTEKRPDGFHNIETVFYPVNWTDALEIIENKDDTNPIQFSSGGMAIDGKITDNIIYKAWQLVLKAKSLPPIKIHLHKNIPMGAGLGGGSSDAAFFVNLLDQKFDLGLSIHEKTEILSGLGSDCAFFVQNKPVMAAGKGNEFSEISVDLGQYYILVVYPGIHSVTKDAYEQLIPKKPLHNLKNTIENHPLSAWKDLLVNDFETTIFKKYPAINELKQSLYQSGAVYASMSGSGSAVFGIFDKKPTLSFPPSFKYFLQNPVSNIL